MRNLVLLIGVLVFICGCKPVTTTSGVSSFGKDASQITTVGDLFAGCEVKQNNIPITHKQYPTMVGFMIDPFHECYHYLIKNLLLLGFKEGTYQEVSGYSMVTPEYEPEESTPVISVYTVQKGARSRKHWSYNQLSTLEIPPVGSTLGFFTMYIDNNKADLNPYIRVQEALIEKQENTTEEQENTAEEQENPIEKQEN